MRYDNPPHRANRENAHVCYMHIRKGSKKEMDMHDDADDELVD